ncbi:4-(cytidine 5'-diphospho)-2-C-methyl-D-erythritol kinase [Candidatus Kapabacteria bacterium]|nr:4-(cytidine 5'-diphospho)-2-C-methyl-D-erythritol kinase [Candidatus Kapabacteria bacterium]
MIRIKSYAKINIGLQVLYKRKDGFHNINTVFAKIDLADELLISDSDNLKVTSFPDLGIDQEENLVFKAAKKLSKRLHKENNLPEILIKKEIPTGAGLGGGSSNAAYAMKGLLQFWGSENRKKEPEIIAPMIGSDVPFFLKDGWAIGKGKGEILEHFNLDLPLKILIINPGIHVNTAKAYNLLNRNETPLPILNYKSLLNRAKNNPTLLKEYFINDFEDSVFKLYPLLEEIKNSLYDDGAIYSSMTGSGSTIFGLFDENRNLDGILTKYNDYYTKICKFVK